MAQAWVGVVGALIGGVLAFGGSYFLQLRREKAEARAAKAVMRSELEYATRAVKDALSDPGRMWPAGWDRLGGAVSWTTYRPVLALSMSDEDFETLARARLEMQLLETSLAAGRRAFVETDEPLLRQVDTALTEAKQVLDERR